MPQTSLTRASTSTTSTLSSQRRRRLTAELLPSRLRTSSIYTLPARQPSDTVDGEGLFKISIVSTDLGFTYTALSVHIQHLLSTSEIDQSTVSTVRGVCGNKPEGVRSRLAYTANRAREQDVRVLYVEINTHCVCSARANSASQGSRHQATGANSAAYTYVAIPQCSIGKAQGHPADCWTF